MAAPILKIKRGTTVPSSLLAGELALNTTSGVVYVGDGTSVLSLGGSGAFVDKTSAQTVAGIKTFTSTISGSIDGNAATATALATGRDISLTGDVTGTASAFNGSANASISATLANSGVSAGTHTKVTVNAKGLVTTGANLEATDIPTLTASKISDFNTQVRTSRLDQMAAPSASVSLNSQKITGLADPTSSTDAANKGYVDTAVSGLVDGAPDLLNTLNELAAAINDDANYTSTLTTALGTKLAKASNLSDLTDASVARTNLGVAIGSNVQAYDAELAAIAEAFNVRGPYHATAEDIAALLAIGDGKAHLGKDGGHLVHHLHGRMDTAPAARRHPLCPLRLGRLVAREARRRHVVATALEHEVDAADGLDGLGPFGDIEPA